MHWIAAIMSVHANAMYYHGQKNRTPPMAILRARGRSKMLPPGGGNLSSAPGLPTQGLNFLFMSEFGNNTQQSRAGWTQKSGRNRPDTARTILDSTESTKLIYFGE